MVLDAVGHHCSWEGSAVGGKNLLQHYKDMWPEFTVANVAKATETGLPTDNKKLASCQWGPVTGHGVGLLREIYTFSGISIQV